MKPENEHALQQWVATKADKPPDWVRSYEGLMRRLINRKERDNPNYRAHLPCNDTTEPPAPVTEQPAPTSAPARPKNPLASFWARR